MLDKPTKKRIDDCRDILVGKIPDPKSQIEQITIALIYKFMDDMDKENIELGGDARYFSGEFAEYAWNKLFDPQLKSADMVRLYGEAIEKMELNANVPELFRNIFKNAYLPYRDPETLKMFLKTIGEFHYSHSEKLGDAFEYLLSVMGSQGDAGQFRTPRHIIDFMVALMNPTKDDVVLDPACGTAGFLISAYKHILKENSSNYKKGQDQYAFELHGIKQEELTADQGKKYSGDKLTPDERARIIKNIKGYDISPDMVRLSLVNLYLHGFSNPHIFEYDSLSSEDRWGEEATLFLANPPFMTPKGGIRPHKRFSVPSNRAEVLFVDYMAEHLTKFGRAAIIVPEGIIFQSGKAYKSLRKLLVENDQLVGVISLPAGVFQPYSGVKTSILWLDKKLAKKTNNILFAKVQNDGFDLGAQRRPIKQNDLPEIFTKLQAYQQDLAAGKAPDFENDSHLWTATKKDIAENGDFNLSGERYKSVLAANTTFPMVKIGDAFKTSSGGTPSRTKDEYWINGTIPWLKSGEVAQGYINESEDFITEEALKSSSAKLFPINSVLIAMYGATTGAVGLLKFESSSNQAVCAIYPDEKVIPEYLYYILKAKKDYLVSLSVGGAQPNISQSIIKNIEIPLPPLSVQEEIVAEVEGYQKIIDGARMVVENYKPHINIDPDWEMVELGEVCEVNPKKSELKDLKGEIEVSFAPMADLNENNVDFQPSEIKKLEDVIKGYTYFRNDDVLLAKVTPCFENGKAGIAKDLVNEIGFGSSEYYVFRPTKKVRALWLYLCITSSRFRERGKESMTGTGGLQRVPKGFVECWQIPLPSIEVQDEILAKVENQSTLVNSTKQLIEIYEAKIKERIGKVWGEPADKNINVESTESETSSDLSETKNYPEVEAEVRMVAEE